MKKVLFLILVLLLSLTTVSAYPGIIYKNGVDIDRMRGIVYSIDESLFDGLWYIKFSNEEYENYLGYYRCLIEYEKESLMVTDVVNKNIIIYKSSYDLSDDGIRNVILHELGHNDFCSSLKIFRYNIDSEDYADSFASKYFEGGYL